LDSSLGELDLQRLNNSLAGLIESVDGVVKSPDLTNSLTELRLALGEARALIRNLDGQVEPLVDSMTNTLQLTQETLTSVQRSVEQINSLLATDAPLTADLSAALDELALAARSIADLSGFLQRHPNALISGKKTFPLNR